MSDPALTLVCVELCGATIVVPFGYELKNQPALVRRLFRDGWFLSVVSKKPDRSDLALAPLCPSCVQKVHAPEVVEKARDVIGRKE